MKNKLKEILNNPNDMLIAVDMDNTICKGEFWGEGNPKPIKEMIDFLWKIYKKGAHIIIYTARQPKYFPQTQGWLIANEVPFHGIAMIMKPGADIYLDDKALNVEDLKLTGITDNNKRLEDIK